MSIREYSGGGLTIAVILLTRYEGRNKEMDETIDLWKQGQVFSVFGAADDIHSLSSNVLAVLS